MSDIPIPAARVRQLLVLCQFLATLQGARAAKDYRTADQILATRFDMGQQARDAVVYLETALGLRPGSEG